MSRRGIRAGGFALAFLAVYAVAILTPLGQDFDAASLGGFAWLPSWAHAAAGPVRDATAVGAGVVLLASVGRLLLTRRIADAARVCVAAGGVAVAGEVLKLFVLPRPRLGDYGYPENTFPSVHAAFVAVALGAALRVVPRAWDRRRWRWTVAVVVFAAGLVGPLSYAHRASDSVGGILLAGLALVALFPAPRGEGRHPAAVLWARVAAAVGVAGLVLVPIALARESAQTVGLAVMLLIASAAAWLVRAARGDGATP